MKIEEKSTGCYNGQSACLSPVPVKVGKGEASETERWLVCNDKAKPAFSMLKIQSGSMRDLGDQPMGGLALNASAEKLQAMMILALIIGKSLRYQEFYKKLISEASLDNLGNISRCGKFLTGLFTKVKDESLDWLRKNSGMVTIKGIG